MKLNLLFMALAVLLYSANALSQDTSLPYYQIQQFDSTTIEYISSNGDTSYASYFDTVYAPVWYTSDTLSVNEVTAQLYSSGPFFFNSHDSIYEADYHVPNTMENTIGRRSVFSQNIWLGGIADDGALHLTAESYRQGGEGFWHGPIADTYDEDYDQTYNKVWKIDRDSINYHIANYSNPDYVVPYQIQQWPAHGNAQNGEAESLAPYYNVAGSWMYEPELGDYPKIEGDQALFIMLNEDRIEPYHYKCTEQNIGVEVHALFYAFDCDEVPSLNQTSFVNYTVYNRSENNYTNFKIGINTDFDLGYYLNDYIGCDTNLNMYYCYSDSSNIVSQSFGPNHPAIGLKFLNQDINNFLFYSNDFTNYGNPISPHHVYNLMHSKWRDDNPLTFGENGTNSNNPVTNYMYPSNPNDTTGWYMYQANVSPDDMRCVGSLEGFTFEAGSHVVVNTAIIFAWDSTINFLENVNHLLVNSQHIQDFYDGLTNTECTSFSGNQEFVNYSNTEEENTIYPNPSTEAFYVRSGAYGQVSVFNAMGQKIHSERKTQNTIQINSRNWPKGIYFVNIDNQILKFVKE